MAEPLDILAWALAVGATAAGLTVAVRALPPVQRWMFQRQKPWACDVCMSFWTTAAVGGALAIAKHDPSLLLACGPAYPWALQVLHTLTEPRNPPPMMPTLEE
jgi:hypothetical protein